MAASISSPHNPKIKQVVQLGKRNVRERLGLTVVEGGREIELALGAGIVPVQTFVCPPLLDASSAAAASSCYELAGAGRTELYEVSPDVYAKIAYRDSVGGLLAVVPCLGGELSSIPTTEAPLALVVESAEKPGNLGALLRTADAAGVSFVIVCGDGTDVNNPNVVRASLGAIFTVPVVQADTQQTVAWLRANAYRIVAASPDAALSYTQVDLTGPTAIAVGSEAHGLSRTWLDGADFRVHIPMNGKVDSLNLSTSTAILLYEAVRQRSESFSV